jgi:hypothetical protein
MRPHTAIAPNAPMTNSVGMARIEKVKTMSTVCTVAAATTVDSYQLHGTWCVGQDPSSSGAAHSWHSKRSPFGQ